MLNKFAELLEAIDFYNFIVIAKKTWGPYTLSNGRKIVIVKNDDGTTKTISYPKFLMQEHLGYELADNLTVDHWDSDFNNNDIDNLKVIDRSEHSKQDTRRVKLIKLKCDWCGKDFERSPRLLRDKSKKGCRGKFCSKSCAGKYSRKLQLKLIDKFDIQPSYDSEYYKMKYASFTLTDKYAYKKQNCLVETLKLIEENPELIIMTGPPDKKYDTRHFWAIDKNGKIYDPTRDDYKLYDKGHVFDLDLNKKYIKKFFNK